MCILGMGAGIGCLTINQQSKKRNNVHQSVVVVVALSLKRAWRTYTRTCGGPSPSRRAPSKPKPQPPGHSIAAHNAINRSTNQSTIDPRGSGGGSSQACCAHSQLFFAAASSDNGRVESCVGEGEEGSRVAQPTPASAQNAPHARRQNRRQSHGQRTPHGSPIFSPGPQSSPWERLWGRGADR